MELPLLNSLGSSGNPESDHLPELNHSFLLEESFNEILTLERKRTARSKRPFILILLNLAEFPNGDAIGNRFISCFLNR